MINCIKWLKKQYLRSLTHARQMLIIYGALTVTGIIAVWLISGDGLIPVKYLQSF